MRAPTRSSTTKINTANIARLIATRPASKESPAVNLSAIVTEMHSIKTIPTMVKSVRTPAAPAAKDAR